MCIPHDLQTKQRKSKNSIIQWMKFEKTSKVHDFVYVAQRAKLWQRLQGTGSVWIRYEIGEDKAFVYTGPAGSGTDRIYYLVPNESTYEGDLIWNRTVPVSNRSRVP